MAKESEAEAIKRIQQGLKCSEEEAREVYQYDLAVEKGEQTAYDLTPEQERETAKYRRVSRAPNEPTAYKFNKRERKPNATKGMIIAVVAQYLAESTCFDIRDLQITNKERQIKFCIGDETFELTLVQKRKGK